MGRRTPQIEGIRLIVGLGNPVPDYEGTRHNAGARLIEILCQQYRLSMKVDAKLNGRFARWIHKNKERRLLLPNTYMNHSGQCVGGTTRYFQIPAQAVLIVHDELDLPVGTFQFKSGGGHAGHNGLKDIMHHLHTPEFHRLRIGIGHPGHKDQVADYVLKKPSREEDKEIRDAIQQALSELPTFIESLEQNTEAK